MRRLLFTLLAALGFVPAVSAGVIVVANFTPADLTFTVAEPNQKPRSVTLAPAQVAPVRVTGPADITFPAQPANATLQLDPYHAYVFLPDEKAGRRLEGIELPGDPPAGDAKPEPNPTPTEPVKIPVTLLVDDADPRADELWQKTVRKRFDDAAAVVSAHAGVKFEFAGFATWKSDADTPNVPGLLTDFAAKVKVKPGALAVGFTSRKVFEDKDNPAPFGACRTAPTRHVLVRDWAPRTETEKVEVLIHHLGLALGAVYAPDQDAGSVMRTKLADGLALNPRYRFRFDPLNALAMNLWVEELRRGPVGDLSEVSAANQKRLARVYKALLKAHPGDTLALAYLNEFDREVAKNPVPKKNPGGNVPNEPAPAAKKQPDPSRPRTPRDDVARAVVRAVTTRARANNGPGALSGDDLTAAYIKDAAAAALHDTGVYIDSHDRMAGFLIGLGVALDDTDTLRADEQAADAVREVESDADREERLAVIGNPTIRGRRDLCRRFAAGCGAGEALGSGSRAEDAAVRRMLAPETRQRPAGVSLPALAAEFAGIALAEQPRNDVAVLRKLADGVTAGRLLADTAGLRDGVSAARFAEDFGDTSDRRFESLLADIRARVKKVSYR